jgi:hypothetical protein
MTDKLKYRSPAQKAVLTAFFVAFVWVISTILLIVALTSNG